METPLSHIMEITKTSAKEITDHTGINVTLLSKFKNNQRKLQYRSRYPLLLADFFLQCRAEQNGHVVRDLLVKGDSALKDADFQQLREALALWLSSELADEAPARQVLPVVDVFQSTNDLKTVLEDFTRQVLAAPAGRIAVIHDFPTMSGLIFTG